MSKIHVIIPAAGSGSRTGQETPKQFARIGNKTIIEYIEGIFSRVHLIDSISIALHPNEKFISSGGFHFLKKLIFFIVEERAALKPYLTLYLKLVKVRMMTGYWFMMRHE